MREGNYCLRLEYEQDWIRNNQSRVQTIELKDLIIWFVCNGQGAIISNDFLYAIYHLVLKVQSYESEKANKMLVLKATYLFHVVFIYLGILKKRK